MITSQDMRRVLLDALSMALNAPTVDNHRVIELCNRLDSISGDIR